MEKKLKNNDDITSLLEKWQIDSLGHTKVDIARKKRIGVEEFVYGEYKSFKQLKGILTHYQNIAHNVLFTRLSIEKQKYLKFFSPHLHLSTTSGLAWLRFKKIEKKKGNIVIITAGTSDFKVAVESVITLKYLGYSPIWIKDAGVAGIQRILSKADILKDAHCLIVIAGMEAALPVVVSSLTGKPVIAVPTSVGYGVADNGLTALKGILSSCVTSLSAVNIDNGFGAACFADAMFRQFSIGKTQ